MANVGTFLTYMSAFLLGAAAFVVPCCVEYGELNGKRFLRFPLTVKYQLVLICGGLLAVLCLSLGGLGFGTALRFAALVLLASVVLTDLSTMQIPNWLSIALAVLGVLSIFVFDKPTLLSRAIGIFSVSVPLLLLTLLIPDSFGGGDIKLMAACGILLGWRNNLLAAFLALVLGGIWGVFVLVTRKKKGKEHFAFGPCLCIGVAACMFFGDILANWFVYLFDFSRFF